MTYWKPLIASLFFVCCGAIFTEAAPQSGPPASNAEQTAGDNRFVVHGNGTGLDTKTGLMWAVHDNGREISWHDAKKYCESFRGGGYTNWRMPTQEEAATLYDSRKIGNGGCHMAHAIDMTECTLWNIAKIGKSRPALFMFKYGGRQWRPIPSSKIGRALPVRSTETYRAEK